jgi:hypothetical protein
MPLEHFEHREHADKTRNTAPTDMAVPTRPLASRRQSWAMLSLCLAILLMFACKAFPTPTDDTYRAFYYNAAGELLEVEVVSEAEASHRLLEDVATTKIVFPHLTAAVFPKISGTNKVMSKFATVAVYYTYDGARPAIGEPNVPAIPVKVEDLQWVQKRTLATCAARASTDPCPFPRRCHCVGGSCCCY